MAPFCSVEPHCGRVCQCNFSEITLSRSWREPKRFIAWTHRTFWWIGLTYYGRYQDGSLLFVGEEKGQIPPIYLLRREEERGTFCAGFYYEIEESALVGMDQCSYHASCQYPDPAGKVNDPTADQIWWGIMALCHLRHIVHTPKRKIVCPRLLIFLFKSPKYGFT